MPPIDGFHFRDNVIVFYLLDVCGSFDVRCSDLTSRPKLLQRGKLLDRFHSNRSCTSLAVGMSVSGRDNYEDVPTLLHLCLRQGVAGDASLCIRLGRPGSVAPPPYRLFPVITTLSHLHLKSVVFRTRSRHSGRKVKQNQSFCALVISLKQKKLGPRHKPTSLL